MLHFASKLIFLPSAIHLSSSTLSLLSSLNAQNDLFLQISRIPDCNSDTSINISRSATLSK
ncbi:unnamed protein product, partial [Heterobilharzia americana]